MPNEYNPDHATHPGEHLKEIMDDCDLSLRAVAIVSGIDTATLTEILRGKRDIDPDIAKGLAAATNYSAEMWLSLQRGYDADMKRLESLE